ncbi:hypothetical protein [Fodinicola feengrottensis]|uniref:Uncharacterized protein n=1 Tax=Fodinicola feengrottensis TaxID=435914 RepID=A0ABN2I1S6_9ACTN|nr:hypothetical protein [Fodinicola feengrottensis]
MSFCRTGNVSVAAGIIGISYFGESALGVLGELLLVLAMLLFARRVWFQLVAIRREGAHRA